ncbi:hypothetical protein BDA99DRAFT_571350 [Phascolomyces articulosus]|uniref:ARS-binding protein 1 N-terminal domain-containing protein n=1 Tax=Phascolomyces articulosus TaxID=60185 RepID=A0AAD5KBI7_9FUNG|nr:hypothetical protein BDA99DRAFT_571350 [Phascolomyces articulosus]
MSRMIVGIQSDLLYHSLSKQVITYSQRYTLQLGMIKYYIRHQVQESFESRCSGEKEPKITQSELTKWAKDEFKLEKVPHQQTISDILKKKKELMAGQSTILILKSFETCTSRVT